ncbi:hypothetical protein Tcan_05422 [Toxocara canis]|uniref:Uncharacterized protein n=1 Tax=Toxocara canis TaxID=6265 RepID=A0A0B2VPK6_TOXCA|nr:hypothetical protein Tcan_05422 [Toxocara canis]
MADRSIPNSESPTYLWSCLHQIAVSNERMRTFQRHTRKIRRKNTVLRVMMNVPDRAAPVAARLP